MKASWVTEMKTMRRRRTEGNSHEEPEIPERDSRLGRGDSAHGVHGSLGRSRGGAGAHAPPSHSPNKHFGTELPHPHPQTNKLYLSLGAASSTGGQAIYGDGKGTGRRAGKAMRKAMCKVKAQPQGHTSKRNKTTAQPLPGPSPRSWATPVTVSIGRWLLAGPTGGSCTGHAGLTVRRDKGGPAA